MEPNNNVVGKVILALVVIAIAGGIVIYTLTGNKTPTDTASGNRPGENQPADTNTGSAYKDGTYTVSGNYVSPGGPETVGITLVIEDDKIVDASAEVQSERPASQQFQGIFAANFKAMIVGKSLDEVSLSKVSGSSLTPDGFNDAVAKIKAEARS